MESKFLVRQATVAKYRASKRPFQKTQSQEHLKVMARSRPEDKYLLVTGLKNCGACVAVTGDGTNDAMALRKADVASEWGLLAHRPARKPPTSLFRMIVSTTSSRPAPGVETFTTTFSVSFSSSSQSTSMLCLPCSSPR